MRSRSLAALGLIVPLLAACGSAPGGSSAAGAEARIPVTVNDQGCSPSSIEAAAGKIVFEVTNAGSDIGEFEVLSGTRVVDEVENIVPGFLVNFTTRLDGGSYELICYTLQAPRGTLAVSGGAAPSRPPSAVVDEETLSGYQAAYSEYVRAEAAALVTAIEPFVTAIESGDLESAKAAYAPSRPHWERIEPVAELFSDLDTRMDAREEDFALGVDDPEFLGWHRLEKGLWADGTTDELGPIAVGLRDDVAELKQRLDELDIEPRVMARGAGELIEEVAQSKLTGEEDRYSQADLWSIEANVAGSKKIVDILRPTLETVDAAWLERADAAFADVDEVIAKYRDGDGFQLFSEISEEDLKAFQARMAGLSEVLAELPGILGLEA